jgi:hypothetical protein
VLPADNIVPPETLSADNMEGSKRFSSARWHWR